MVPQKAPPANELPSSQSQSQQRQLFEDEPQRQSRQQQLLKFASRPQPQPLEIFETVFSKPRPFPFHEPQPPLHHRDVQSMMLISDIEPLSILG